MRRALLFAAMTVAALSLTVPASALTAGEVLSRMSDRQQTSYIAGAVDAFLYMEQLPAKGDTPRSNCILEWYYGKSPVGPKQVTAMFASNQDKLAIGLIKILIDRACGRAGA